MKETWKDIPGFKHYQASSLGRIRSLPRRLVDSLGRNQSIPGGLLKPKTNKYGYLVVVMSSKNMSVHRAVCAAFLNNPNNKPTVNHKNFNKTDNRVENLEWATRSENTKHSSDAGRLPLPLMKGQSHPNSKLKNSDIPTIFKLRASGMKIGCIAKLFNMSRINIGRVLNRQTYKSISICLMVLALTSCRKDPPPSIEICIISDGGSADCVLPDGTKRFRLPSEMVNYWATSQTDMKNFSSWCYSTSKANIRANMEKLEVAIKGN